MRDAGELAQGRAGLIYWCLAVLCVEWTALLSSLRANIYRCNWQPRVQMDDGMDYVSCHAREHISSQLIQPKHMTRTAMSLRKANATSLNLGISMQQQQQEYRRGGITDQVVSYCSSIASSCSTLNALDC